MSNEPDNQTVAVSFDMSLMGDGGFSFLLLNQKLR